MVRVSVKNTFLSFNEFIGEEDGEQNEGPTMTTRQIASPRSRSVDDGASSPRSRSAEDAGSQLQIQKLNRFFGLPTIEGSPPGSPPNEPSSPKSSNQSQGYPNQLPWADPTTSRSGSIASTIESSGSGSEKGFGNKETTEGPSVEELRQLMNRLQAACLHRDDSPHRKLTHVTSNGSVSTMASDGCDSEKAVFSAGLHLDNYYIHGAAAVEFDFVIEEGPEANRNPSQTVL